jgi:hypothetical protein
VTQAAAPWVWQPHRASGELAGAIETTRGSLATRRSGVALRALAAISMLAATVHVWVAPEHLQEWWGYGIFFLATALAQGICGPLLLRRPARWVLLAGAAGNLAVLILWLVTRTTGIPFFGPHAGDVEPVGFLDLLCALAEAGLVVGLGITAMRDLATEGRIQVVVVAVASSLLYWHLLHLLAMSSAH